MLSSRNFAFIELLDDMQLRHPLTLSDRLHFIPPNCSAVRSLKGRYVKWGKSRVVQADLGQSMFDCALLFYAEPHSGDG
jgi:hypothetical protein